MILVDTSVWVEHLRSGNAALASELGARPRAGALLRDGELACGTLRNRREVLDLLGRLPSVPTATHAEALAFLDQRALIGRGIGFVDVHLLASAALAVSGSPVDPRQPPRGSCHRAASGLGVAGSASEAG